MFEGDGKGKKEGWVGGVGEGVGGVGGDGRGDWGGGGGAVNCDGRDKNSPPS